jgi:hypothetical protein
MITREIPKDEWQEFCDAFSRLHQGWLADLQVEGQDITQRFEARGLPFEGISYSEKGSDKNEISISINRDVDDHLTHFVVNPTHLHIEQSDDGVDQGLAIESRDGEKTIVHLINPTSPATASAM